MSGNSHLVPDIIKDLLSKVINSTDVNERARYLNQAMAIRDACAKTIDKATTMPFPKAMNARKRN